MRFCKDCRYFKPPEVNPVGAYLGVSALIPARCYHPELTSMVTGEIEPKFCAALRGNEVRCGQSGKWFEQREAS